MQWPRRPLGAIRSLASTPTVVGRSCGVQPREQLSEGTPLGLLRTGEECVLGLVQWSPSGLGGCFDVRRQHAHETAEQIRQGAVDGLGIGAVQPVGAPANVMDSIAAATSARSASL